MSTNPLARSAAALAVACLAAAPARRAPAQTAPVSTGDWVRVTQTGGSRRVTGRVVKVDSALLTIRPAHQTRDVALQFPFADMKSLEYRTGRASRGQGALRGAGWGAFIGFGLGAALTVGTYLSNADENCNDCFWSPTAAVAVGGALLTVGGTAIGAVAGAAMPGDRWQRVALPARVTLTPLRPRAGGVGLALAVRF